MEALPALTLCELADAGDYGLLSFSPFCIKVLRALRALGLPYQSRRGPAPDSFAELNPQRQVPVLLVDDVPITDSTDICAALSGLAPGRGLLPGDARERAQALLWEEFADTSLNGFVVAARWADPRNWPRVRDVFFSAAPPPMRLAIAQAMQSRVVENLIARDVWRAGSRACWRRFTAILDELNTLSPDSGFWVGDTVSVADVAIFGQLQSLRVSLTPWQASRIARRPALSAYLNRVASAT